MNYVILGSSAAGINAARELRSLDSSATITMVSKDEVIYSRCILHHYLGEIRTIPELNFAEKDFFKQFRVQFFGGEEVIGVDTENKLVSTKNKSISYDKLLIATGSNSFMPPIENLAATEDAVGFRNLDDIEKIKLAAKEKKHIVVLGAGLVGMDCVAGLLHLGLTPTLLDLEKHLLIRQLDDKAASAYSNSLEASGVVQHYGMGVSKLNLDGKKLVSLTLSDGSEIPCDFLVVTVGVRPSIGFLKDSGIEVDRFGLTFDEFGQTNIKDVYGAGDVSGKSPIWPVAVKEGIIAANNMFGKSQQISNFFTSKSTMNFFGIPTMSLGDVNYLGDDCVVEVLEEDENYKKIIHKDGKIIGALLQGDLSYSGILQQLILHKIDVRHVKKSLFDIDYSDFFQMDENFEFYYK